ncbi:MAG: AAA family ATPase [Pseudanabaena sp. M57BS1SP1A06MG]|jgi:predicted ATPase|nr:AAA family ATPase [Pseudanabaena sp. M53BS1SP1A06MG]MCA6591244.1 AAA family ATPase [Pseudanabaena sp. M38BS1SP1A06MG]MCA6601744.1 AAA family ATPase [Pseudanabaena sp. M57BS1SP1A06MG]
MLQAVRIEGLRSLTDTGFIDIKPLTILVGENSSGKSTFLRFFPLLRQSLEANTSGPILWSGFVDFGTYQEARHNYNDSSSGINFHFKFRLEKLKDSEDEITDIFSQRESFFHRSILRENSIDINLMLGLSESIKETTRISKIEYKINDSKITIEIAENLQISKFEVNSLNILDFGINFIATSISSRSMIPTIVEFKDKKDDIDLEYRNLFFRKFASDIFKRLQGKIKILSKIRSDEKVNSFAAYFCQGIGSSIDILNILKRFPISKSWQNKTAMWEIDNQEFQEIRDLIIAINIPYLLEDSDRYISNLAKYISYVGPARVTAEQRSQRVNEFSVSEIDPQGRNLSLFLRNLDEPKKQDFDDWTSNYFGFKTVIRTNLGHITLNIFFKDSQQEVNIADIGFGFSQMLPIITQLWLLSQKNKNLQNTNNLPIIFAIEQPELHLHPRMQKVLTDVLVSTVQAAKDNNIDLRLLIETHSQVLVNQVGNLIYKHRLNSEDVNIVVFEKFPEENSSRVKRAFYNSEGYLEDWPIGFFDPGVK